MEEMHWIISDIALLLSKKVTVKEEGIDNIERQQTPTEALPICLQRRLKDS